MSTEKEGADPTISEQTAAKYTGGGRRRRMGRDKRRRRSLRIDSLP